MFEIDEIKSVHHVPISHPFVERLIGTIRREYLDQTLFWNRAQLSKFTWRNQDPTRAAQLTATTASAFQAGASIKCPKGSAAGRTLISMS